MKYKLVAVDLDGTFLNSNSDIPQKNIDAAKKLTDNGCIFVIITGRMYTSVKPYLKQLNNKELVGLYQGGIIIDSFNDEIIYKTTLKRDICQNIYFDAVRLGLNVQAYDENNVFIENYDEYTMQYENLTRSKATMIDSIYDLIKCKNIVKLLINTSEGKIKQYYDYFSRKYSAVSSVVERDRKSVV